MSAGPDPGDATTLASPLSALPGIGAARARALAAAGLATVRDLLFYLPYRYEDRSSVRPIASMDAPGETVTLHGRLIDIRERRAWARRMRIVEAVVDDGTGALAVVWFNQPFLARSLRAGAQVWLHGPLRPGRAGSGLQLVSPEWEEDDAEDALPVHLGRVVPIYRRLKGWNGRRLRALVADALAAVAETGDPLAVWLPADLALAPLAEALRQLHFPEAAAAGSAGMFGLLERLAGRQTPAHRRLAFEEMLSLAATLETERGRRRRQRAVAVTVSDAVRDHARAILPFALTAAQKRTLVEIVADLQRPYPMARLLQGDVGSGKTIVATLAALVVLESRAQVALLAPTELLAQQHRETLAGWLRSAGHTPELLLGSLGAAEKRRVRQRLASGEPCLVVGTHALLEDAVGFERLGLAIVDEQHRFGAAQRQALLDKGEGPHLLVMTATPIPRSLALTLYGDLDVSLLDELPPGRTPVRTVVRDEGARTKLLEFVAREAAAGGQAYWVFPVIDESEKLDVRAVTRHARSLAAALPGIATAVVHGRLPAAERDAAMRAFAAGEVKVLCATTVIEVGVDVPNASLMVIENAERFGVAQLHQLRGRVGRGSRRSFCVLLAGEGCSEEARRRLDLLASTGDGFRIAEEDFRMRGPGELTGLRQWGRPELRVASLLLHRRELEAARTCAAAASSSGRLAELCRDLGIAGGEQVRVASG
jgi:ATP-dependent DNA helicase RecG